MKKIFFIFFVGLSFTNLFAQKVTFDLFAFTPPAGWKKEVTENIISYTSINNTTKSWCRIGIVKSTISKGSIEADFESEWQDLIVKNYNPTETPVLNEVYETDGWKIKEGVVKFKFNNADAQAMLTTISGFDRCASIIITLNNQEYLNDIDKFLQSVEFKKMGNATPPPVTGIGTDNGSQIPEQTKTTPAQQTYGKAFSYSTTNFDDGWVAAEQEDWVQVTKGNMKVLIHYAKEGTTIAADPEPHVSNAWNILVGPRYSNLRNFKVASPSLDPQRAYLGAGDATDNKTGRQVYVALFRKGNSGWVEFIAPDKNTFVREFGTDVYNIGWDASSDIWNPLLKMFNYNKFAVSANDLPGNWYSASGSNVQYFYVYTGNNAGMAFSSSTTEFNFYDNGTYKSVYKGVDNTLNSPGNRYYGEVCEGKSLVTNWQIQLTNRFKGATETFTAQFEAVKGGRILHMYRGNIEELHLFRMK
jgi:hypothetical protein